MDQLLLADMKLAVCSEWRRKDRKSPSAEKYGRRSDRNYQLEFRTRLY